MRSAPLFLLLFSLSGCYDRGNITATLPSPSPPKLQMKAPGEDGDVQFGSAALDAWLSLPESERSAGRAILRGMTPESELANSPRRLAIVEGSLPDGAAAWVIRDPAGLGARLLVIPRESLTRELFVDAASVLAADEQRFDSRYGRRFLRIESDGRVVDPSGSLVRTTRYPRAQPPLRMDAEEALRQLRASAAAEWEIDLPEVGRSLVLTFR